MILFLVRMLPFLCLESNSDVYKFADKRFDSFTFQKIANDVRKMGQISDDIFIP